MKTININKLPKTDWQKTMEAVQFVFEARNPGMKRDYIFSESDTALNSNATFSLDWELADCWLKNKYGNHKVDKVLFLKGCETYESGSKMLDSLKKEEKKPQEQKEVSISELRAVADFCKNNGGIANIRRVLGVLESLNAN